MSLKSNTGKLYMLLSSCIPDDERIRNRIEIESALESKEYRELAECESFSDIFKDKFSPDALMNLDRDTLAAALESAELIPVLVERLGNAIYYGNGWELCSFDEPDYYKPQSIRKLLDRLKFDEIYLNDTNIPQDKFYEIFKAAKFRDEIKDGGYYCIKRTIEEEYINEADEMASGT